MYKIMIIEDDPVIREELSVLLRGSGYSVNIPMNFSNIINDIKNLRI